jgi:hypothetical protein
MPHRSASTRALSLCLVAIFSLSLASFVRGGPATKPATTQPLGALGADEVKFLRFAEDGKSGGRLETSIVTYRNEAGVTVRLVAAVHIGEKAYYEGLNDTFRSDDAVLYEMVKPKGAGAPQPNTPSKSGIGQFQHFLKDSLNLDFQLDDVDYARPNFVHADLDAETFTKMQDERGESMFTLMIRQMMDQMSKGNSAEGIDTSNIVDELITTLCRPDSERQLKLLLARHMGDMEKAAAGLGGPDGSVILTERNKAAFKVLSTTLGEGKKHISVFYGAAHMPGMSETLMKEFGFKPVSVEWRTAWDLAIRTDQPSAIEKFLRDSLKAIDE